MNIVLKKLYMERKEFVTSAMLRDYCTSLKRDYDTTLRYLMARRYLIRIFRGIFYVRTLDEVKLNRTKYNHLELVANGLKIKNVKHWYFGLYTALKLNNITHEYFTTDYVINDSISRPKPITIAGHRFRLVKIEPLLLEFGLKRNGINYSDSEKTILDFIYFWRYNGVPREKIIADVSMWTEGLSKRKIVMYAGKYPKSVREIAEEAVK